MRYTKMHGAGNSFLLTESLHGELAGEDLIVLARRLCDENTGPGADGMIILVPAPDADLGMLFLNSDGSRGEMCGNGARCLVRYAVEHGLAQDPSLVRIRTAAGLVSGRRISEELVEIRLNDPSVIDLHRSAEADGSVFDCIYTELGKPGIPHAVVEVPLSELDDTDRLRKIGHALRYNSVFPRGANVSFAAVTGPDHVRAVTYERGVEDLTLACGTRCGAIAAGFILRGSLPGPAVAIDMPGGHLSVSLRHDGVSAWDLFLTGPTAVVDEGSFSV